MEEESREMHSEDDKALLEKNKKRTVKTRAQVQALEKFYDEHKYPTEVLKSQLADSIGLTEKQVAGWFCHRRLKDKRLMNGENIATGRQNGSSGVVQDRGSGLRQDSCGSTKQGEDRNFDTREVESGRLNPQEYSAAHEPSGHYTANSNRMDDASSGSSSSLRNVSNCHNGDIFDVATSRYLIPKFPSNVNSVKPRPGPSGYLKVKGQVENSAITAVKRQLGKHYREDGPPLGVEFDPLPPGAFENSTQDPVDETYYSGEDEKIASPDVLKSHQHFKFAKGREYNSSMASHDPNINGTSVRTAQRPDISDNYVRPKLSQKPSLPYNGAYYPRRNSSVELSEGYPKDIPGSEGRDDYRMRPPKQGIERLVSVSSHPHLQPYGGKQRMEQEPQFHKYNDVGTKIHRGENIEKPPIMTMKGYEQHSYFDKGIHRQATKDGKIYAERRISNENRVNIPFKNDNMAPKRKRDEFPQQQHVKRSTMVDNHQPGSYQVIRSTAEVPSSFSEDDESAETSYSME
ncbi:hypothetical protein ACJIZ3_017033 [Penstemon smallii]|uniref:Homeobox domain-containing protein n=1 Tax=Penstemon smallii TaxID=265156 RepID=A0ABD3SUE0_9LAMI